MENPAVFVAQQAALINSSLASVNIDLHSPTGLPVSQSFSPQGPHNPCPKIQDPIDRQRPVVEGIKVECHSDAEMHADSKPCSGKLCSSDKQCSEMCSSGRFCSSLSSSSLTAKCDVQCKKEPGLDESRGCRHDDSGIHNNSGCCDESMEVDESRLCGKDGCCGEKFEQKVGAKQCEVKTSCGDNSVEVCSGKRSLCAEANNTGMCGCGVPNSAPSPNNNNNNNNDSSSKVIVPKSECNKGKTTTCCLSVDTCSCVGFHPTCSPSPSQPSPQPSKKKVSPRSKARTKAVSGATVGTKLNTFPPLPNPPCLPDCVNSLSASVAAVPICQTSNGFSQSHLGATFTQPVSAAFPPVNTTFHQPCNTSFPQAINTSFAQPVNTSFSQQANTSFSQPVTASFTQQVNAGFLHPGLNTVFSQAVNQGGFTPTMNATLSHYMNMNGGVIQASNANMIPASNGSTSSQTGLDSCQQLISLAPLQTVADLSQALAGGMVGKGGLDLMQALAQFSSFNPSLTTVNAGGCTTSSAVTLNGGSVNLSAVGGMAGHMACNAGAGLTHGLAGGSLSAGGANNGNGNSANAPGEFPASSLLTAAARAQLSQQPSQLSSLFVPAILQQAANPGHRQDLSVLAAGSLQQQQQQLQQQLQQLQQQQLQTMQTDPNAELSAKTVAAMMAAGLIGFHPAGVANLSQLGSVPLQLVANMSATGGVMSAASGNIMQANGGMIGTGAVMNASGQLQQPTTPTLIPAMQNSLPLNILLPVNQPQAMGLNQEQVQALSIDLTTGSLVPVRGSNMNNLTPKSINFSPKTFTGEQQQQQQQQADTGNFVTVGGNNINTNPGVKTLNISPKSLTVNTAAANSPNAGGNHQSQNTSLTLGAFSPASHTVVKATGSTIHHLPQPSPGSNASVGQGQGVVQGCAQSQPQNVQNHGLAPHNLQLSALHQQLSQQVQGKQFLQPFILFYFINK
jgi:hypothetical protein